MTKIDKTENSFDERNIFAASGGSTASYIDSTISLRDVITALNDPDCKAFDPVRLFSAKVLVYVGCKHTERYGKAVSRATALLALHPDADMSALGAKQIEDGENGATYARAIKKVFDVNDVELIERIEKLTESKIFTSVDAIYNIANYVRMKFSIGRIINA